MAEPGVTVFICISCTVAGEPSEKKPGRALYEAVLAAGQNLTVKPVDCMSVCKRPCTVALSAEGKWTYVVGDIRAEEHTQDVIRGARAYAASSNGIVPWRERPLCFRRGVIARIPPLTFLPEEQGL
jgi:predicted metal-binding protein